MDLLTQGLLGSALAQSVAKPEEIKKAGFIGLLAGLSADLDFFIQSQQDPLLNLEFHRHFTHSLFFVPIAALVLSLLFWPFFKKQLNWSRIFLYSLLGYLLSGFIDACTSYGTRLFWPISNERISLNIISIIDPIFTTLLILGILFSLIKRNRNFIRVFLFLCGCYLLLGLLQHHRVENLTREYANQQGHEFSRLLVKPTLGNLWLWRTIYLHQDTFYINAIRINPVTGTGNIYPGESILQFKSGNHSLPLLSESNLQKDIERFAFFSDDYLAIHPDQANTIIDIRYANLPNKVFPLWGIHFDPAYPEQHAHFEIYRKNLAEVRQAFLDMLLGR